jgi:tetratricopeptide (TPR) repeat protein
MKRSRTLAIGLVGIIMAAVLLFPNVLKETEKSIEKLSPLDEKVQVAVEMIESGNGNPMEAIFSLREVIDTDSNHRDAQFYLGQFSVMSGQWGKAVNRFLKVLRIDPSDAYALESLAIARFQQGYTEVAIKDLVFFLEEYPNSSRDSELRALLASYQGESQSESDKVQ